LASSLLTQKFYPSFKFLKPMKKSLLIIAFAALTFIACSNNGNSANEQSDSAQSVPAINQDSIDKAHGHSHDPASKSKTAAEAKQDSIDKAHGHSHDPAGKHVNQDSIDKAHGHKH